MENDGLRISLESLSKTSALPLSIKTTARRAWQMLSGS